VVDEHGERHAQARRRASFHAPRVALVRRIVAAREGDYALDVSGVNVCTFSHFRHARRRIFGARARVVELRRSAAARAPIERFFVVSHR